MLLSSPIGVAGFLVTGDLVQPPGNGDPGLFKDHISSLFDGLGKFLHQIGSSSFFLAVIL